MNILERYGNAAVYIAAIAAVFGGLWAGLDYLDARPVLERELIDDRNITILGIANLQQTTGKEIADLKRQVADTATSVLVLTFYQLLDKLKQNGSLSFEDQQRLCAPSPASFNTLAFPAARAGERQLATPARLERATLRFEV